MKKGKLTGWQLVYQFTFLQTVKSKTIKIMTILLCTVLLLSMPIAQLISTVMEKKSVTQIKTVYVVDESGLGVADYSDIAIENDRYKDVKFLYSDKSATEIIEELKNTEGGSVLLHITAEQGTYYLRFIKPAKSSIKSEELTGLSTLVTNSFNKNRIRLLGISEEQMKLVDAPIITEVKRYNQESTSGNTDKNKNIGDVKALSLSEYSLVLAVIVIIIMFFAFGGEAVASSIITEKSTRVIEYLMTSVRPLAIITGKVLAMLTVTLLQFALLGLSFILSCFLKRSMYPQGDLLPAILKGIPIKEILSNTSPVNLILTLLIFIGGFLFFALLAGLTGATVSKIEELAEGIMVFKLTLIIGAYLSMAVCIAGLSGNSGGILDYAAYLLPISAVFITPIYLLLGRAATIWGVVSLLILFLSLAGLALFTAKVYEMLILHQGNRLKFKDLFSMSKKRKGETL